MGTLFKQERAGTIDFNQTLSQRVQELNRIFKIEEEDAERTEGTVTSKVGDALDKMITVSDNYSALLLVSKIRLSNVSLFMDEQGLKNSETGIPPKTTPSDIALFYERLWRGNVVDSDASREMLELLAKQQLNDRIPKYLPKDIDIAHKTGELGGFKHDAGIIFAKDPILFVVLSESTSPLGAAERIALLAKDVFNYFESK
jgi:beta-lactamase class A